MQRKKVFKPWDLSELTNFYEGRELPPGPIRLSVCEIVTDPAHFVRAHIQVLQTHNGNPLFIPYGRRLKTFMQIIVNESWKTQGPVILPPVRPEEPPAPRPVKPEKPKKPVSRLKR